MNYAEKVQELLKMPQSYCNMCGLCCQVASFKGGMSLDEINKIANDFTDPVQAKGARDFLTIFKNIAKEEAASISPMFVKELTAKFKDKPDIAFFKCRFLDEKSNKCLIHEDRPSLCRMYPIPHERTLYHPSCGFKQLGINNWKEIQQIIKDLTSLSQQLEEQQKTLIITETQDNKST